MRLHPCGNASGSVRTEASETLTDAYEKVGV